jgi:hypothetical protein
MWASQCPSERSSTCFLSGAYYTCPGGIKNPLQASISILPIIGFRPVKISRETMINVTEKGE